MFITIILLIGFDGLAEAKSAVDYFNSGVDYGRKGEYDRAIQDFTKAIQINPKDAEAYNNRGFAYEKKGEYDRAIQDFDKAIQINPKHARAYNNRGFAYEKNGEYDKAIQDYDKAIQINPKDARVYNHIAWLYSTCPEPNYRNGTKAVELAEKAISIEGQSCNVVDTLAAAYAEKGRFGDAVRTQKKTIKLAREEDNKNIAEYEKRLRSYEQGKPWREKF